MNSKHEAPDRIWLEYSQDEQHLHLTDELVWTGYLTEYVKAETVRQAATEQGESAISHPDLCPICKKREVIEDEDWCGPCREEFYDSVIEEDATDTPAEQGVGEPTVPMPTTVAQAKGMALVGTSWLQANAPDELKPTGGGVPDHISGTVSAFLNILFHAPSSPITAGDAMAIMKWWEKAAESYGYRIATQQPPEQEADK